MCALLSVTGICSHLMSSCSTSDDDGPGTPAALVNAFAYNGIESKIQSVVYTVDEQKVYTFYLSPTQGLVDLDAMILADDYVQIVTSTPTGNINLAASGNGIIYKQVNISSENSANVSKSALTLQLTSLTTMKLTLDAAMTSGEKLQADYNGTCIKLNAGGKPDPVTPVEETVQLNERIFGYYMGSNRKNPDTWGYSLAMTNTEWEAKGSGGFALTKEGYALQLLFYANKGEAWKTIPTGEFTEGSNYADHTFDGDYSYVLYRDETGKQSGFHLVEKVTIAFDAQGDMTVDATFIDENYIEHKIAFKGGMRLNNGTVSYTLPRLERDMMMEGYVASGTYDGDVFENGTGVVEVYIKDFEMDNKLTGESKPGGYAVNLALVAEKFTDPMREMRLIPGTYKVGSAPNYKQGQWVTPWERDVIGNGQFIMPQGTFGMYDDGTQTGQIAFPASGEIVVRQGGSKKEYIIEFDLVSIDEFKIQGSFSGIIEMTDGSEKEKDDGSSNLKDDYDLDLTPLKRGGCFKQDQIFDSNYGWVAPEDALKDNDNTPIGYQMIRLGSMHGSYEFTEEYPETLLDGSKGTGKLIEGDIFYIDLVVNQGMEEKITPGVYQIAPHRWTNYHYPGTCLLGHTLDHGGTTMMRIMSAMGYGNPTGYFDPDYFFFDTENTGETFWLNVPTIGIYAALKDGAVSIEKADGGDNWFTITVKARDILKHTITGTWTGPIYVGNSDIPAVDSGMENGDFTPDDSRPSPFEHRLTTEQVRKVARQTPVCFVELQPIE